MGLGVVCTQLLPQDPVGARRGKEGMLLALLGPAPSQLHLLHLDSHLLLGHGDAPPTGGGAGLLLGHGYTPATGGGAGLLMRRQGDGAQAARGRTPAGGLIEGGAVLVLNR